MPLVNGIELTPAARVVYPPFKNGLYMEEYFSQYWNAVEFSCKSDWVYLEVFWQNVFIAANFNATVVMRQLSPWIVEVCQDAMKNGKRVFTLVQWDDGLLLQTEKPDNLHIFSIGGSNRHQYDKDIPLPLIAEDKTERLLLTRRLPFSERTTLCSFVGTRTHTLRDAMVNQLESTPGFEFYTKANWTVNIPESMMNNFIQVTSKSRFALAPRGYGNSSFRFFEIMEMGVVPIYVHDDDFGLPYRDILDYSRFAICIHIRDIATLPSLLNGISEEQYSAMLQEGVSVHNWFTLPGVCDYVLNYISTM